MNKVLLLVLTCLFAQPVFAKDACSSFLCMAGLLAGDGKASSCKGFIKDVSSIRVFKYGKFKASRTASARSGFLNSCSGSNPSDISGIISTFGYLYSF